MVGTGGTLSAGAVSVLRTADPGEKVRTTHQLAAAWLPLSEATLPPVGHSRPPDHPARPDRPRLVPPRKVPRRRLSTAPAGRIALLHALAHIELNAIDLAWDLVARFAEAHPAIAVDWIRIADDEARHFSLLADRLNALGAAYGDLPAHNGLWEAACETAHDLLARLAIVPMLLEARALDVTPGTLARLRRLGDDASADILTRIYEDEITHVAAGCRWFLRLTARQGLAPVPTWQALVHRHFRGRPKPPFNDEARRAAGLLPAFYNGFPDPDPEPESEPERANGPDPSP